MAMFDTASESMAAKSELAPLHTPLQQDPAAVFYTVHFYGRTQHHVGHLSLDRVARPHSIHYPDLR